MMEDNIPAEVFYKPYKDADDALHGMVFAVFISLHIWAVIILIAVYFWR